RTLQRLAQVLAEAVMCLQETGLDRPGLIARIHGAQRVLRAGADLVSESVLPEQLRALRGPVTAIAGWTRLLSADLDPQPQAAAVAAIERDVAWLLELLGRLPGSVWQSGRRRRTPRGRQAGPGSPVKLPSPLARTHLAAESIDVVFQTPSKQVIPTPQASPETGTRRARREPGLGECG